ncbi:RNA-binding protein Musashi 2 [Aix galericulata]|nr:RNA-binding protein Musashi 2 [Aix galericulata]
MPSSPALPSSQYRFETLTSCSRGSHGALGPGNSIGVQGSNPARPGGFPGANSPGPVADLYGTASQDSGVGNYISAASPQPGSGFGHGIADHRV